jgi:hypothetical protein
MMRRNTRRIRPDIRLAGVVFAAAALCSATCTFAETLRVTALSLQGAANPSGQPPERLEQAASALKKLNPDVILLRQARDWQMCAQLAKALEPAKYNVLVCSAFRDPSSGKPAPEQVAILAKRRAYISWSDPWQTVGSPPAPAGFAFAAIRIGKQRIGFFSVELDRTTTLPGQPDVAGSVRPKPEFVEQWRAEIDTICKWTMNRIDAVIVAGGFTGAQVESEPGRILTDAAFVQSFLEAPLSRAATSSDQSSSTTVAPENHVLARLAPDSNALPGVVLSLEPATCDLELNAAGIAPPTEITAPTAALQSTPAKASNSVASLPPPTQVPPPHGPQTSNTVALAPSPTEVPPRRDSKTSNTIAVAPPSTHLPLPTLAISERAERSWLAQRPWLPAVLAGLVALGAVVVRFLARRKSTALAAQSPDATRRAQRAGGDPSSETVVIVARNVTGAAVDDSAHPTSAKPEIHVEASAATHTQSGRWQARGADADRAVEEVRALARSSLLALWSQWLKEKLVRRLITDRAELLKTQQAATLKVLAVDERLARIEMQLQNQNRAYERRIEELTRELEAAKEGNRELIRAQIAQVKAEMDAARTRLMAQMREKESA